MRAVLWATAYGFLIMFSYYILRAVRDEISSADRGNLQLLWTAVFFAMLIAVPAYSWIGARFSRGVFVPLANRFFVACLIGFFLALELLPVEARPWIDRVFYVWSSVFALFVVTVFWGFMADSFDQDQGKRLFAFIAVSASVGGIVGSAVTATLAELVPRFSLLLIAAVPLEAASWCVAVLHRRYGRGGAAVRERDAPLGGSALSGIGMVFRSPYLLSIAAFIALMTFASTVLYFVQANLVGEAIPETGTRIAFYARIDLTVNLLTILFQVYLTARIIRWAGLTLSLIMMPALVGLGFLALGVAPLLTVLVVAQVLYRAGRYGIAKPAREVLFTVVGREERYKSKAFIDAAVYRGGDLVSGWIYAGLAALGLSIAAISLVALPFAGLWTLIAFRLGRRHESIVRDTREPALAGAAPDLATT